jgi:hypothetical protein
MSNPKTRDNIIMDTNLIIAFHSGLPGWFKGGCQQDLPGKSLQQLMRSAVRLAVEILDRGGHYRAHH